MGDSGSQSIFSVSKANKRRFRIAMRRNNKQFTSTSELLKWCLKKATGLSFKEYCEIVISSNFCQFCPFINN